MTSSQPPILATWLLRHLRLGNMDEALLGDLFEDFRRGRSAAWYWRQVLAAILVGFVRELRYRWVSTGFAIFWSYGFSLLFTRQLWPPPQLRHLLDPLYGWAIKFDFPISMILMFVMFFVFLSVLQSTFVLLGLGLYLGAVQNFTVRGFLRGSLMAVSVIVFASLGLALIGGVLESVVGLRPPLFVAQLDISIPMFLGLVLSMATGRFSYLKTFTPSAPA
jgi:hypothetical protein